MMTEEEWLTGLDAFELVSAGVPQASPRKVRLFGCVCVAWAWTWGMAEPAPDVVRIAEAFADGLASEDELVRAAEGVRAARLECDEPYRPYPRACEVTELLASPDAFHEILGELQTFAADMFVTDDPDWWGATTAFMRDIFGNPFRPVAFAPAWQTEAAVGLASGIYDDRAFERMPILADALQDAGCDDADILAHCHEPGHHVRGCWVVDLVLGKA